MLNHFKIVLLLFLGFLFSDCATLKNGTSQHIEITSNPPGANVYVDGLETGVTPLSVDLSRKDAHKVQIEKLGYDKHLAFISSTVTPKSLSGLGADILLMFAGANALYITEVQKDLGKSQDPALPVIGIALIIGPISADLFSGAYKKLTPEEIYVTLQKSETTSDK